MADKGRGLVINILGGVSPGLLKGLSALAERLKYLAETAKSAGSVDIGSRMEGLGGDLQSATTGASQAINDATEAMKQHLEDGGESAEEFLEKLGESAEVHKLLGAVVDMLGAYGNKAEDVLWGLVGMIDKFRDAYSGNLEGAAEEAKEAGDSLKEALESMSGTFSEDDLLAIEWHLRKLYSEAFKEIREELGDTEEAHEEAQKRARALGRQVLLLAKQLQEQGVEGVSDWVESLEYASIKSGILEDSIKETAEGFVPLNEAGAKYLNMWTAFPEVVESLQNKHQDLIRSLQETGEAMEEVAGKAEDMYEEISEGAKKAGREIGHGVMDTENLDSIVKKGLKPGTQVGAQSDMYPVKLVYDEDDIKKQDVKYRPGDAIVREANVKPKRIDLDFSDFADLKSDLEELKRIEQEMLDEIEAKGLTPESPDWEEADKKLNRLWDKIDRTERDIELSKGYQGPSEIREKAVEVGKREGIRVRERSEETKRYRTIYKPDKKAAKESERLLHQQEQQYKETEDAVEDLGEIVQKTEEKLGEIIKTGLSFAQTLDRITENASDMVGKLGLSGKTVDVFKNILEEFKGAGDSISTILGGIGNNVEDFVDNSKEDFKEWAQDVKETVKGTVDEAKDASKKLKKAQSGGAGAGGGDGDNKLPDMDIKDDAFVRLREEMNATRQEMAEVQKASLNVAQAVAKTARVMADHGVKGVGDWSEKLKDLTLNAELTAGRVKMLQGNIIPLTEEGRENIGMTEEMAEVMQRVANGIDTYTKKQEKLQDQVRRGVDGAEEELNALEQLADRYGKTGRTVEIFDSYLDKAAKSRAELAMKAREMGDPGLAQLIEQADLAQVALAMLTQDIEGYGKSTKIASQKGVEAFGEATREQIEWLGNLSAKFDENESKLDEWRKEIARLARSSTVSDKEIYMVEKLGELHGRNADNVKWYQKEVRKATSDSAKQHAALYKRIGKDKDKDIQLTEEQIEMERQLLDPKYALAQAHAAINKQIDEQEEQLTAVEKKKRSVARSDEKLAEATEMVMHAVGASADEWSRFSRRTKDAKNKLEDSVDGMRTWVANAREMAESGDLTEQELSDLTRELAKVEGMIKEATDSQAIYNKTMEDYVNKAEGFEDGNKTIAKSFQKVQAQGVPLVRILEEATDKFGSAPTEVDALASSIVKLAKAFTKQAIEAKGNIEELDRLIEKNKEDKDMVGLLQEEREKNLETLGKVGDEYKRYNRIREVVIEGAKDEGYAVEKISDTYETYDDRVAKASKRGQEFGKALQSLGDRFGQDVEKVGRYNSAIGRVNSNFRKTQDRIKGHIAALESQAQQTDKTEGEIKSINKQIAQLNRQLEENAESFDLAEEAMEEYMEELDPTYKGMGLFTSRSMKMRKELGYLGGAFMHVGNRFKQFAAFTIAAAALMAVIEGIEQFIEAVAGFDQAVHGMMAILEIGIDQVAVLGDVIKKTARNTIFSATELAEGIQVIGQAGFSLQESMMALEGISMLATATQSDFADVVELSTTAIRAFGLEATQTSKVADIFTNAINNAKVNIDKLKTSFNYVGAAGHQAGLNLNEVTGTLMVLADNGLRASTMGTGLRRVMLQMVSPTAKLTSAMAEVGVELDEINPKTQGWLKSLKNLAPLLWDFETNTVDMARAVDFFGTRAANAIAVLVKAVATGSSLQRAIDSTYEFGSAARAAGTQAEGLANRIKIMWQNLENLAITLGEAGLTDTIKAVVSAVIQLAQAAEWVVKTIPGFIQWSMIALSIGGVGKVMLTVAKIARKLGWRVSKLAVAFTSPFAIAAYSLSAFITLLIRTGTEYDRAARKAGKAAEKFNQQAQAARSWAKALAEAAEEGAREYRNTVRRMREDENAEDFVKFLEEDMGLTIESLRYQLDELAKATSEYDKITFLQTLAKDAEKLQAINDELLAADPMAIKKQYEEGYKGLWGYLKDITSAPFHAMWRGITGVGYEDIMEQKELHLKRIRDRVLALMDNEVVESGEQAMQVFDAMYKGVLDIEDFKAVRQLLVNELNLMKEDAESGISKYKEVFDKLAPEIREHLKSMTSVDQFKFKATLTDIEEKVLEYQKFLEKEQNLHYSTAVSMAAEYRDRLIREKIAEHEQIKEETQNYYQEALREMEAHYQARRELINETYDWEMQLLESDKPLRSNLRMRENVLSAWERIYDRSFEKAIDAEEGYLDRVADINEQLRELRVSAAQREMNTRYLVLEKERERKDELLELAREEAEQKIEIVSSRIQQELKYERLSEADRRRIIQSGQSELAELERAALENRRSILNEWLGTLRSSYSEAIDKEREYAQAIEKAQSDIADIRREAAQDIRENSSSAEEALKKISRAGMTETELQKDKLDEAQEKMRKAYDLIQSSVVENQGLAKDMAQEARDIFLEFGVAAAKSEESVLKQAEAEKKVIEASELVEDAIKKRKELLEEEQEAVIKKNRALMDHYTLWANELSESIGSVQDSLDLLQATNIEPKYFDVESNAQLELDRLDAIERFDIHNKHYDIIAHHIEEGAASGRTASKAAAGSSEAMEVPSWWGYAEGGEAAHPAELGAKGKGTDTIPAWLTPGEYVVKKAAVQKYGTMFLESLNKGKVAIDAIPKFVRGGFVKTFKSNVEMIPQYAKGGMVQSFTSFMDVIPRYAKGGVVKALSFAEGGGVPGGSLGEGSRWEVLLSHAVEQIKALKLVSREGFARVSQLLWDMTPPDLGIFFNDVNEGIRAMDSKLAYQTRLMIEGNSSLQNIEGAVRDLAYAMSQMGKGSGDIHLNNYAGDARKMAFDIQRLQKLGQAPSLG